MLRRNPAEAIWHPEYGDGRFPDTGSRLRTEATLVTYRWRNWTEFNDSKIRSKADVQKEIRRSAPVEDNTRHMERDKRESKPSSWTAGLLVRITVYHSSSGIVLLLPRVSGQCHYALISIHTCEVMRTATNLYVPNNCAFVSIYMSNYTNTTYRHTHYVYFLSCRVDLEHPTLSIGASYSYYCRQ